MLAGFWRLTSKSKRCCPSHLRLDPANPALAALVHLAPADSLSTSRLQRDSILKRMGIDIPADGSDVPPDFVIAQRADLNHIENLAKRLGLNEAEYDLYGKYKAKVCAPDCVHLTCMLHLGITLLGSLRVSYAMQIHTQCRKCM